jgi:hypothetical protein
MGSTLAPDPFSRTPSTPRRRRKAQNTSRRIANSDHRPIAGAKAQTRDRLAVAGRHPGDGNEDSAALALVADLLSVARNEVADGRRLLTLLGDPLRRVVFEHLARRQYKTGGLAIMTGATRQEISHRVRTLSKAGAVLRTHDHFKIAAPYPVDCLRKYLDVLLTIAVYTHGGGVGVS